jgi:hypothetical protein
MDVDDTESSFVPFLHFAYLDAKLDLVDWGRSSELACRHGMKLKDTSYHSINDVHCITLRFA